MKRHQLIVARTAVALLFLGAFFTHCAHIMTPDGGPKDTIPPVIVRLDPDNFTTNFKAKKVYIEFDEFVQIKDQNKEVFTSPAMKKMPLISTRGRGIVITLRDTLQENTTYAIDFGSAIRDNNEGNPLNAMRYVFSTGDKVDSLMCSGYTADSYKADSVSRTYIWFYIADSLKVTPDYDSTMFNVKPHAIARAQNNGIFIAQNLKPVDYRVYAFADKNDNKLYEPGTDMVGIVEGRYNPATMPEFAIWFDSLRMYPSAEPQLYFRMFTDKPFKNQRLVEAKRTDRKQLLLYFNTANPEIESLRLDSIASDKILFDPRTKGKDTLNVWLNVPAENLPDTIKGEITYYRHDSVRQYVKTTEPLKMAWRYIESKEEQREREKLEKERAKAEKEGREWEEPKKPNPFKYKSSAQGDVNPEKGIDLTLDYPVVAFDTTAVKLYKFEGKEGATQVEVAKHFELDTLNMGRWLIHAKLEEATKYRLYIPKQSITDIMGYQNDSISSDFTTFDPEKFATLTLTVKGDANREYIIQQTDNSGKMQQEKRGVKSGKCHFNYVSPGDIRLRIIEDNNCNGVWDAGDLVKSLQPERAEMYINEKGEDVFVTKANWEMEITLDMNTIFKPMTMQNLIKMLDDKEASRLKKLHEEWLQKQMQGGGKKNNSNQSSGGMGGMMGGMGSMMGGGGLMGGFSNALGGSMGGRY